MKKFVYIIFIVLIILAFGRFFVSPVDAHNRTAAAIEPPELPVPEPLQR
ncbi:hypothetical protein [Microbulbifer litoralis]|nr:hypothetical protein [Microbulbifer sp. GX H0434]